MQALASTFI